MGEFSSTMHTDNLFGVCSLLCKIEQLMPTPFWDGFFPSVSTNGGGGPQCFSMAQWFFSLKRGPATLSTFLPATDALLHPVLSGYLPDQPQDPLSVKLCVAAVVVVDAASLCLGYVSDMWLLLCHSVVQSSTPPRAYGPSVLVQLPVKKLLQHAWKHQVN